MQLVNVYCALRTPHSRPLLTRCSKHSEWWLLINTLPPIETQYTHASGAEQIAFRFFPFLATSFLEWIHNSHGGHRVSAMWKRLKWDSAWIGANANRWNACECELWGDGDAHGLHQISSSIAPLSYPRWENCEFEFNWRFRYWHTNGNTLRKQFELHFYLTFIWVTSLQADEIIMHQSRENS